MLFFTFLFFLFDAVTGVTLNFREGKIEGTTKYSSIGDKLGFQIQGYASQKNLQFSGGIRGDFTRGRSSPREPLISKRLFRSFWSAYIFKCLNRTFWLVESLILYGPYSAIICINEKTYIRNIKVVFITVFDTVEAKDGSRRKKWNHYKKLITKCPCQAIFVHIYWPILLLKMKESIFMKLTVLQKILPVVTRPLFSAHDVKYLKIIWKIAWLWTW